MALSHQPNMSFNNIPGSKYMHIQSTRFFTLLLLLTCCLAGCTPSSYQSDDSFTVFRSVLDQRARMITMRLHDDLWVAYSAENGALYRVWRDGVDFDGAVYTTAHGPQPTSIGPAYIEQETDSPWLVLQDGNRIAPVVQYKGHSVVGSQGTIELALVTPDGETIKITETPSFTQNAEGQVGLTRTFTAEHVPENTSVIVEVALTSLSAADSYETSGTFSKTRETSDGIAGNLTLLSNGITSFTGYFGAAGIEKDLASGPAKPVGLALIEGSDCVACHNQEVQTVGPSYVAIAERYDNSPVTEVRLANKVIQGGSGVWGEALMTPHPNLPLEDAKAMVAYILSLDDEASESGGPLDVGAEPIAFQDQAEITSGLAINMYELHEYVNTLEDIPIAEAPFYSGIVPALHAPSKGYMVDDNANFFMEAKGTLRIPATDNYVFRLVSDDGSRLYLDGDLLIDHDGPHGPEARDSELILDEGVYPIRVEYFESGGGAALSLQWARHGDNAFSVIPSEYFASTESDLRKVREITSVMTAEARYEGRPGDTEALKDVHPSFSVETIRPDGFEPKVGGLDVMEDGRVLVSTWDPEGSVYLVSNIEQGDRSQINVKRIAKGLAEPLGLKVVDGDIYVLQKQELTRLIDTDGDEVIDVYETIANNWGATSNFHEFAFGLVYKEGYFYATLATAILPGGASANPQDPDRGTVIKISKETGEVEIFATGLRTPNGIGLGIDDELYVADNQGDWLPSSKIVHIQEGEFYGSRSVDFEGTANLTEKKPVSWLPQDEIGNSPSQPVIIDVGPYQDQLIHGEVTHGGIKRVFVEEVDGQQQGALFRFTQGLEAGVNRLVWGPDDKLYIGGIGNPGNWGHAGKYMHGLQRMTYTGAPVFEMLAIRAQSDGFEIEFTEPLAEGVGEEASDYAITQWYYLPTIDYGGPKLNEQPLAIQDVTVSADRKRVRLTLSGMQPDHMVYFHLNDATMKSEAGRSLWSTEAWYTLNRIPNAL